MEAWTYKKDVHNPAFEVWSSDECSRSLGSKRSSTLKSAYPARTAEHHLNKKIVYLRSRLEEKEIMPITINPKKAESRIVVESVENRFLVPASRFSSWQTFQKWSPTYDSWGRHTIKLLFRLYCGRDTKQRHVKKQQRKRFLITKQIESNFLVRPECACHSISMRVYGVNKAFQFQTTPPSTNGVPVVYRGKD